MAINTPAAQSGSAGHSSQEQMRCCFRGHVDTERQSGLWRAVFSPVGCSSSSPRLSQSVYVCQRLLRGLLPSRAVNLTSTLSRSHEAQTHVSRAILTHPDPSGPRRPHVGRTLPATGRPRTAFRVMIPQTPKVAFLPLLPKKAGNLLLFTIFSQKALQLLR